MIHKNIKLVTSNELKIKEFKRFGLPFKVVKGVDLKEVDSDYITVVTHKAIEAGEGMLVEDTVLLVNGEEIVDIKWRVEEIQKLKNPEIKWITSLGILENGII